MVGLPGWGLAFQLAQPTLGVWPGGNWLPGSRAGSRAKSCVAYEVAPEMTGDS